MIPLDKFCSTIVGSSKPPVYSVFAQKWQS